MYFKEKGIANTAETVALAVKTARERGIKDIVVSTSTGYTPSFFTAEDIRDFNIVLVTHTYGMKEPGVNTMEEEKRAELSAAGFKLVTAAHALSGAERAMSGKFGGVYPIEIIAHTLRMFGQGTKVCVEIGAMAADAGAIKPGIQIMAIAGTGRGADTALIMKASHTNTIFNTKIDEVICKPIE